MNSFEKFKFSSTVKSDFLSHEPHPNTSVASSNVIDDLLVNPQIIVNEFNPAVFNSFSEEPFEECDESQSRVFPEEMPTSALEQASEPSAHDHVDSLRLLMPPDPYQRARYDGELDEDLRFISTPSNKGIVLEISDIRSRIPDNMAVMLRASRTTTPFGTDETICCHPYPLSTVNKQAIVHHGSLLFPVSDKNIEEQRIIIDDLIMSRLKQSTVTTRKQWPIFTYDQVDCAGYHNINLDKAKSIINTYNLRYSVLHFQIFLVDQNQIAHSTYMSCKTEPIYEYEYKEQNCIPEQYRNKRNKSNTTDTKRKRTGPKQKTIKRLNGLIRTTQGDL
ncbi:unnamed protein product [Adineta ricciae]|uniref:Uncharacterized protein n=1 Tax=Adineta ricciae TaxID=249248 RepID=A0A815T5S0_ADIRI|nr:unnamed protein product [Adineta ricciae]